MGSGGKSHATGESVVPESVQRVAPEKLEKALPESVHPVSSFPPPFKGFKTRLRWLPLNMLSATGGLGCC